MRLDDDDSSEVSRPSSQRRAWEVESSDDENEHASPASSSMSSLSRPVSVDTDGNRDAEDEDDKDEEEEEEKGTPLERRRLRERRSGSTEDGVEVETEEDVEMMRDRRREGGGGEWVMDPEARDDTEERVDGGRQEEEEEEEATSSSSSSFSSSTPTPGSVPCRSIEEYERLNVISEGTFGFVFRARCQKTGEIVALKRLKLEKEKEGFPITALREIDTLLRLKHPNIVNVREVVVGHHLNQVYMVMEYMEHDIRNLMENMQTTWSVAEIKCLMRQLLSAIAFLHENWCLHRDLKTSNLLYGNNGVLKVCDFGLARHYGDPVRPYTNLVVTQWYRSPELLLGAKEYTTAVDMWSVGCIFAELFYGNPFFQGKDSEADQVNTIFRILGTPNDSIWPGYSLLPHVQKFSFVMNRRSRLRDPEYFPKVQVTGNRPHLSDLGLDLLERLLAYDPNRRISAAEALNHEYLKESPVSQALNMMPTFPSMNESENRHRKRTEAEEVYDEVLRNSSSLKRNKHG